MKLNGLNHLTLAVRDLERAWDFYTLTLGASPTRAGTAAAI